MATIQQIITDTERLLSDKEKALAFHNPDNYRTAEFLDEQKAAYRRASIALLTDNIRELRCLIAALKAHQ